MCEALRELFAEELEESKETGRREGIERGMEQGMELAKSVFKMHADGTAIEEIAKKCRISRERVKEILE